MVTKRMWTVAWAAVVGMSVWGLDTTQAASRDLTGFIDSIKEAYGELESAVLEVKKISLAMEQEQAVFDDLRAQYEKTRDPRIGAAMAESAKRLDELKTALLVGQVRVEKMQTEIRAMLDEALVMARAEYKKLTSDYATELAHYENLRAQYEKTRSPRIGELMNTSAQRLQEIAKQIDAVKSIMSWIDTKIREAQQWGFGLHV